MCKKLEKQLWLIAFCLAFSPVSDATAQSVEFGLSSIRLNRPSGPTILMESDPYAALILGGNGFGGSLHLRDNAYRDTIVMDGETGDVRLGGAGQAGALYLRDHDGVTTTVSFHAGSQTIVLGGGSEDGDLQVKNVYGGTAIQLDGESGNLTNNVFGDGLVKAWARYHASGLIHSCWNCSDNGSSIRVNEGGYIVDFSPLTANIGSRPLAAVIDSHGDFDQTGLIEAHPWWVSGQQSAQKVFVQTYNSSDEFANRGFTVFVF